MVNSQVIANIKGPETPSICVNNRGGGAVVNRVFLCVRISPGQRGLGS